MAVMCRLLHKHVSLGNTRALNRYIHQRREPGLDALLRPVFAETYFASHKQAGKNVTPGKHKNYLSYLDMLKVRRKEAERSILVEIEGLKDSGSLKTFCGQFGRVKNCYLYRASGKNFVLIEFEHLAAKNNIINTAFHSKDPNSIPITSPFLYYYHSENLSGSILPDSTGDLQSKEETILQELKDLQCPDDIRLKTEIYHVHKKQVLSDLSIRLRFFTCHQLDVALNGLFDGIRALPFGSSLCGFGSNTGDLDIFLHCKKRLNTENHVKKPQLYFLTKASVKDKNLQLKLIGDLISIMLPGCSGVMSILSARVPIIKYRHSVSNLECDVNNCAASGIDLTQILWLMNHWDSRVAPLVFALRMWAQQNKISVQKKPSPTMTNFQLVIMVIFFLQRQNILPTLHSLQSIKGASPGLDTHSDIVFPDLKKVNPKLLSRSNNDGVDTLFCNFFDFYSKFDFEKQRISIWNGKDIPKVVGRPLEIENPVDPSLNISQNVSYEGLKVLKKGLEVARTALAESKSLRAILPQVYSPPGASLNQSRPHTIERNKVY